MSTSARRRPAIGSFGTSFGFFGGGGNGGSFGPDADPQAALQLDLQALAIPDSPPLLPRSLMRSPKLPLELQSHPDEVLPSARQRSNGQEYKGSNC